MSVLEPTIASHPFFKGLAAKHISTLASCAMQVEFGPDQYIFQEGEVANRFYLILSGQVVLESHGKDGGVLTIQELNHGEVLGWSWLFPPYYWHFDARTTRTTETIFFYGTRLREQCEIDHDFGFELMKRTAEVVVARLQITRHKLLTATGTQ